MRADRGGTHGRIACLPRSLTVLACGSLSPASTTLMAISSIEQHVNEQPLDTARARPVTHLAADD